MRNFAREMDQIFVDEETGESISLPVSDYEIRWFDNSVNNAETGEPEISLVGTEATKSRRIRFQIPKEVKETLSTNESFLKENKNLMGLEPVPIAASFGQMRPVCILLLAIVSFRWLLPLLMLFEVLLQVWAHHKNKALKNASVYLRSLFHPISSEFCALCQDETCMDRVDKMQQIQMHKLLRQYNYMKNVVT